MHLRSLFQSRKPFSLPQRIVYLAIVLAALACSALLLSGLHVRSGHADIALVLGAKVYRNGVPSPALTARLDETVKRYRQGHFPLILVSGGIGKEQQDEAVVMQRYLIARGVPETAIIIDSAGVDTFASVRNLQTLMQERNLASAYIVTQYFHIPRTKLAMRRFGIRTLYWSSPRKFFFRDLYSIPRELIAYLWYATREYP